MESQYSLRSPAVKRLMKEAAELREPTELFFAQPLEDNLFEWHFSVRGPPDTEFEGGIYHGRIMLPPEYPMKPPSIVLLTPNGRFELNKKICLSISGFHPESWQPSWSIRTALLAIIGFMPTHGAGAIGSLDYPPEERKVLAKKSLDWKCTTCSVRMREALPEVTENSMAVREEAKQLAQQISFKDEREQKSASSSISDSGPIPEEVPGPPVSTDRPSPPELPSNTTAVVENAEVNNDMRRRVPSMGAGAVEPDSSTPIWMIIIVVALIAFLLYRRVSNQNYWNVARSDL